MGRKQLFTQQRALAFSDTYSNNFMALDFKKMREKAEAAAMEMSQKASKFARETSQKASALASDVPKKATEVWSGAVASADEVAEWAKTVPETIGQYAKDFDVDEMWEKISSAASKAGQDVIVMVLTMYYSIEDYIKRLKK